MEKQEQEIATLKATIEGLKKAICTRIGQLSHTNHNNSVASASALKELEWLKTFLIIPELPKETEENRDVRAIAISTFKQYMDHLSDSPLAWHVYKKAFDIASFSLPVPRKKGEYVICSAVKYNDTIVCGRRHANCYEIIEGIHFYLMGNMSEKDSENDDRHNQGFITSTNRFVDRKEAFRLAKINNQIVHRMFDDIDEGELTSEDLFGIDH